MGVTTGWLRGLVSAVADLFQTVGGYLLVRSVGAYTAGTATITVEGTHRWPSTGEFVVNGMRGAYTGITNTSFTGITDEDGNVGLPSDMRSGSVVMYYGMDQSDMDLLRRSFLVDYAEGVDLDVLARNHGLYRPRGMSDAIWSGLLKVLMYLDAQTEYSIEKVMTVLEGAGNFDVYERHDTDPHRVFVVVAAGASAQSEGKAWIVGKEPQAQLTPTTVQVDYVPRVVSGVWSSVDPFRVGTNYAMLPILGCYTAAAQPKLLQSLVPTFLTSDEGKSVYSPGLGELWQVLSYMDPLTVRLGGRRYADGDLNSGTPTRITVSRGFFLPWMVGHRIRVITTTANAGSYVIAAIGSPREASLTGAAFTTEINVEWELEPEFGSVASWPFEIHRATSLAKVITTPVAMPANVLVDYATVPSAQLMLGPNVNGDDQYPFYIWDETATIQAILDMITAAGVEPVVEVI